MSEQLNIQLIDEYNQVYTIDYQLSMHVQRRKAQRGISNEYIKMCLLYGDVTSKQGLSFYYAKLNGLPANIPSGSRNKINNLVVVCDDNTGMVITSYWCTKGPSYLRRKRKDLVRYAA